jgi:DNA-3-methyladenine glycosylase II
MNSDRVLEHFDSVDPIMAKVVKPYIATLAPLFAHGTDGYLSDLCESIVSQQLSVKAASTIWLRTHAVVEDWNNPLMILEADTEELRGCGLSYQKASYVKNIAGAVAEGSLHVGKFDAMTDEEISQELIKIKGIGQWTTEMFLIFTMGRSDVFSAGDLGLRNAIKKLYGLTEVTPSIAQEMATKWSPYRSVASRVLWKTLDNEPSLVAG